MFAKTLVCSALLTVALSASAQTRKPVGTVYQKYTTDCANMIDPNGYPMCSLSSSGSGWTDSAPYTDIMTMTLPFGRYVLNGKVLNYSGTSARNPWVVVECVLRDGSHNVIDYTSDNFSGGTESFSAGAEVEVLVGLGGGTAIVLEGTADVGRSGTTVSIACRVQGQSLIRNADGSHSQGPIQDVRFHSTKIIATAVSTITTLD